MSCYNTSLRLQNTIKSFFLALLKSFIDSIVLILSENKFKIFAAW